MWAPGAADACIELETNRCNVPWRRIGETVSVLVNEQVRIVHAGQEVHTRLAASAAHRRAHLLGIVGTETRPQPYATQVFPVAPPELLRPLHEAARYLPLSLVTGSQPLEFPGPLREDSTRRRDLQTLLRGNSKASLGCVDGTPGSE